MRSKKMLGCIVFLLIVGGWFVFNSPAPEAQAAMVLEFPYYDILNYGGGTGTPAMDGGAPCEDECETNACSYLSLSAPSSVAVGQWFWVELAVAWESDDGDSDNEASYGVQAVLDFDPDLFEVEDGPPTIVLDDLNFTNWYLDNTTGYYAFMVIRFDKEHGVVECVWCENTCSSGSPPCPVTVAKVRVKAKTSGSQTIELGDGHGELDCILNTIAVFDEDMDCADWQCQHITPAMRWERRLFGTGVIHALSL